MNDLADRLSRLDQPGTDVAESLVVGDLIRGRAAIRRRRRARGVFGGATLALVAVAGYGLTTPKTGDHQRTPVIAAPSHQVALVSYQGEQLEGFEVTRIPAGFFLQGSDEFVLTIAPNGDTSPYVSFVGKLVVSLQSTASGDEGGGEPVTVTGHRGSLRTTSEGARILEYDDGTHDIVVQAWETVGLTDAQLLKFAEGLTVTSDAIPPEG